MLRTAENRLTFDNRLIRGNTASATLGELAIQASTGRLRCPLTDSSLGPKPFALVSPRTFLLSVKAPG
jgi:hypothetical protein